MIPMKTAPTLSRRQMVASMAALPLLRFPDHAEAAAASRRQATFVLVHGAWHGGWCWKKLTPSLRAAGHEAYAPTLTGMGDRSDELTPEVGLGMHIMDITAVLEYEDLHEVVLVGHSYGGMVISGVAEKTPERIAHLVYLDAFLPEDGKSLLDYAPLPPTREDGWRVPTLPPSEFGISDERDLAWVGLRLGDQPLKTFTQPVLISGNRNQALARTFIQATPTPWFAEAAARAKRDGFGYRDLLSAGHDAMITDPAGLARILLELV